MLPGRLGIRAAQVVAPAVVLCPSCCSPRAAKRSTASWAWKSAPTTIWPSRSIPVSWWPAFAPFCGEPRMAVPGDAHREAMRSLTVGEIEMSMANSHRNLLRRSAGRPDLGGIQRPGTSAASRWNVVTREQIAEVALGRPLNAFDRSVDVHVSRLRKKLSACPSTDELIRPIRGIGYFLPAETPEKSRT